MFVSPADAVDELDRYSSQHGSSAAGETEGRQTAIHRSQRRKRHCCV